MTHYEPQDRIDPLGAEDGVRLPSPVTAFGTGINRSLKPETFSPAVRQLYRESYSTGDGGAKLDCVPVTVVRPGQQAAAPGREAGRTDQTRYTCGTSNAAALTTRAARLPPPPATEPCRDPVLEAPHRDPGMAHAHQPAGPLYRRAHLWFDPKITADDVDSAKLLKVDRCDADSRASRRGTVQHEIFEGEKAAVFAEEDARSSR